MLLEPWGHGLSKKGRSLWWCHDNDGIVVARPTSQVTALATAAPAPGRQSHAGVGMRHDIESTKIEYKFRTTAPRGCPLGAVDRARHSDAQDSWFDSGRP